MIDKQQAVDDFMRLAGQYSGLDKPGIPDLESRKLRFRLIHEELKEFADASGFRVMLDTDISLSGEEPSVVAAADAIADLLYVVYGTAVAWGINIEEIFIAVHEANMRKFDTGHAREDGKWIKGPDWQPPDLVRILNEQGWQGWE